MLLYILHIHMHVVFLAEISSLHVCLLFKLGKGAINCQHLTGNEISCSNVTTFYNIVPEITVLYSFRIQEKVW